MRRLAAAQPARHRGEHRPRVGRRRRRRVVAAADGEQLRRVSHLGVHDALRGLSRDEAVRELLDHVELSAHRRREREEALEHRAQRALAARRRAQLRVVGEAAARGDARPDREGRRVGRQHGLHRVAHLVAARRLVHDVPVERAVKVHMQLDLGPLGDWRGGELRAEAPPVEDVGEGCRRRRGAEGEEARGRKAHTSPASPAASRASHSVARSHCRRGCRWRRRRFSRRLSHHHCHHRRLQEEEGEEAGRADGRLMGYSPKLTVK